MVASISRDGDGKDDIGGDGDGDDPAFPNDNATKMRHRPTGTKPKIPKSHPGNNTDGNGNVNGKPTPTPASYIPQ